MSKRKMSLRELDFNNIGSWPKEYQVGFCTIHTQHQFGQL